MPIKTLLVTGGAGFIGTNFIRHALTIRPDWNIINLDALTYAGNLLNFRDLDANTERRHRFVNGDINDSVLVDALFSENKIDGVINFAAESHVDRSIHGPEAFVQTNVSGTFRLLEASRRYWTEKGMPDWFRFLHVSTDEVYGSLGDTGYFTEQTAYDPSSPYSASKAASDHFVRAWHRTYGLPTLITNCSNNFGPFQFPEKLIPLMILNIVDQKPLPIYGDGKNVRDWLFVIDHCEALIKVFEAGTPGETYNIGGNSEQYNIDIVHRLCDLLDARLKRVGTDSGRKLIRFVTDRPGHDRRYAIDAGKIKTELGWQPRFTFDQALEQTAGWYLDHMDWTRSIQSGDYRNWIETNYHDR